MTAEKIIRHLRFFARAESIIAEIHLRHFGTSSIFSALAVLLVILGFVMLSVAAYFALVPLWGQTWAAAAVAGGQIYLAAMAALVAHRSKPKRELQLANEVRQAALEALQDDAQAIQAELAAFTSVLRHPLNTALPGLIVPLAGIILKALKRPDQAA